MKNEATLKFAMERTAEVIMMGCIETMVKAHAEMAVMEKGEGVMEKIGGVAHQTVEDCMLIAKTAVHVACLCFDLGTETANKVLNAARHALVEPVMMKVGTEVMAPGHPKFKNGDDLRAVFTPIMEEAAELMCRAVAAGEGCSCTEKT